ncbi:MAG: dipeptide/oligopeptide/nickel ABC transporter ATP-binding protein [Endomicrobium sp.]|jgi:ABC-type glutathione transport system ATPase component|nr:dipeptide/oligopeptide/nickel ABC transporter ATP-binding protein [Endomicrobium sp.]
MLLEVINLSKKYVSKELFKENNFLALDTVGFSLSKGEYLSVIGSSGCGKTTLGKIIAGLLEYDAGSVKYFDKDIKDYSVTELSAKVQMIFQNPYASLNPKLRIKSSLSEALNDKQKENAEEIICKVLESVGLDVRILNNYPHQFSGGQRQRIAVARILLKNPQLIIADEPFASLDIYSQTQILEIFKNIEKTSKTSMILITHDIAAASRFAERMIIMKNGKIVKDSSFEKIFNEKENKYISDLISAMEL